MDQTCRARCRRKIPYALATSTGAWALLVSTQPVNATPTPVVDLSTGLTGWTVQGDVTVTNATVMLNPGGAPFSLTPAAGQNMAQIIPSGGAASVDALLGLSALSIEGLLNNSNGSVTNFGVLTQTLALTAGTYSFAWAYAANDYQPFNDGVMFSLVGAGAQSIVSLARNGSDGSDLSGPSPATLILGSYGTTAWETTTFTVASAGSYQIGFASYNWNDTNAGFNPELFVSGIPGTFTGTPVVTSGGAPPSTIFDTTGGDVSASVFDTSSTAYAQSTLEFAGGTLQFSTATSTGKNLTLDSAGGILDTNGHPVMLTGVVSGAGAFTKIGAGTLQLSGLNDFTGLTTISAGTLSLAGVGSIADSSGLIDNGTLDISATTAGASITTLSGSGVVALGAQTLTLTSAGGAFSGVISGLGGLTVSGGTEVLSGTNTYTGATAIGSGATLALSGAGSIASSAGIADNGTLDISATSTGASLRNLSGSGAVTLGAQMLTLTNANGVFAGAIAGTGGLSISGGTETLTGSSAYQGGTTISGGGTVIVAADAALGAAGGALNLSGGTLATTATIATGRNLTLTGSGTFDTSAATELADLTGSVSGSGTLLKSGTGTLSLCGNVANTGGTSVLAGVLNLCGNDTGTGSTAIASGAMLALSGTGGLAHASAVVNNGTLDISGTSAGASLPNLSGTGTVALGAQALSLTNANGTFAGIIAGSGGFSVAGGSETLTASNAYTGGTTIAVGATLVLSAAGSIASSSGILDNGTLDVSASSAGVAARTLAGSGTLVLGPQTLTLTDASGTFAGSIGGLGGFAVTGGTETLSGTNAYVGGTAISNGGALVVASDAALGDTAGGLTLNNGTLQTTASFTTKRDITLIGDGALDVSAGTTLSDSTGSISGAGVLIKSGAGALSLCGGLANAGGVAVTAGALTLCGIDTSAGATSIAAGATLLLSGAGRMTGSSGVADDGTFDISAAAAGVSVQSLSGAGTVALGAQSLNLTNANGAFTGVIAGAGAVALSGGTETLSGVNTYRGGTSVSAGARLIVTSDASLGDAAGGLSLNNATLEAASSFSTARSISVTGSATLDADPGVALMQTGQLSGNGRITKDGDGTLVLAGDNSHWGQAGNAAAGGLTIDDGLVEVANSYGLGYGPVTINSGVLAATVNIVTGQSIVIAGDTTLNTDADTTTTLTGTVETAGAGTCLQKTGPGTLVMTGTATLSNGTCVQDGRLLVNGILNSTVNVATAGTLRGTGVINGAITVMGTLAPGNSPGTLRSTGTVNMAPGSTFQEDINGTGAGNGPGNYSRLLVMGPASQFIAGGATLDVNLLNITGTQTYTPYTPQLGDSFVIVAAQGGVVGRFAPLAQPAGLANGTRLAVIYDTLGGDSIDLRVVPTSYRGFLQGQGANGNVQSAGGALDQVLGADSSGNANAAVTQVAAAVSTLNAAELPRIMTALAGEVHADLAALAPEADQWLQGSVARQLDAGDAADRGALQPGDELWLDSTASRGKWNADAQASRFTTDRMQIAFGFDLLGGQANRFGIGFSHALANVASAAGDGSVEQNMGFLYGQAALAPLIVDGLVGAGSARWDTSRRDPLGFTAQNLMARPHGNDVLASAGVRWPWHLPGLVLAPYVRALWQRTARDNFDEGSAPDALSGPGYEVRGVRTTLGVSGGSESQSPLGSVLTYQFNVGVAHDGGDLSRPVVQATLAGAPLEIVSPRIGATFVLGNITGTVRLGKRAYVYVGVSAESRSGKSEDAGVNFGMRASI